MKINIFLLFLLCAAPAFAGSNRDILVKFTDLDTADSFLQEARIGGAEIEDLGFNNWVRIKFTQKQANAWSVNKLRMLPNVAAAQPNYKLKLVDDYQIHDPALRDKIRRILAEPPPGGFPGMPGGGVPADNPEIPSSGNGGTGADPLFNKQWGMLDIGVQSAWSASRGQGITVAVIDSGVDYTHEDLVENLWRNEDEVPGNGADDDNNGFVDDVIGWDFVSNDNKPFDLAVEPMQLIFGGGNPGHGTHCAGNVAARGNNGRGIAGVGPDIKIMSIRFLSEKGQGTTADGVKAVKYAIDNGAKVLSNSWGSEGEDPQDPAGNQALRDVVQAVQDAGALFVAAAGNGRVTAQGTAAGYNNDTDAKPGVPASYPHDTVVSVAAIDSSNNLGVFSNFGPKSVDIGAPGVKVFSTTVGSQYNDIVLDLEPLGLGIKVTWDGTSMAAPHVAGAAAVYWARNPSATYLDVKNALIKSAAPVPALQGKVFANGKLNVNGLMSF